LKGVKVADRHLPKSSFNGDSRLSCCFDGEELLRDYAGKGKERRDPSVRFSENWRKLRVQVRFCEGETEIIVVSSSIGGL